MLNKTTWQNIGFYYLFLIVCSVVLSIAVGFATTTWIIIMLLIVAFVGIPLARREIKLHRKELSEQELISVGDARVK